MPALPRLAAPPPPPAAVAPSVLRTPPTLTSPPRAPYFFSTWNSRRRYPRRPSATAADAPRGGPLPEPEELDQLLILTALRAARIRDEESRRSDPLFIDPYAAVLLSHDVARHDMDYLVSHGVPCQDHYRLTTRYIDDKLQSLISNSEDIRQSINIFSGIWWIFLLTESVSNDCQKFMCFSCFLWFTGTGAKVSRNCVLLHTPLESPDLQEVLSKNGFNGNRLSLWVLQGLPLPTTMSLENLLLVISNLAMKGSIFIGELPHFPDRTSSMDKGLEQDNLEKLFFSQGFRVSFVQYDDVAKDIGLDLATSWEQHGRLLFVAEQLRLSDAQVSQKCQPDIGLEQSEFFCQGPDKKMESFRMHFERIEEDADEEGFEEL
ncbi:hypothetical protein BAE44_0018465 [Dichanthelium oligosanthes]|uniref:Uncharacterized protein n=1 Tax=Dichanthelium oligosanthes TaxID=888268 RepID=A0A1E5V6A0_9POAL|nr:hypothetical protein BAE44_0018465 [Dichanthelium oligosanthes]